LFKNWISFVKVFSLKVIPATLTAAATISTAVTPHQITIAYHGVKENQATVNQINFNNYALTKTFIFFLIIPTRRVFVVICSQIKKEASLLIYIYF
jgi:hypothetical protein